MKIVRFNVSSVICLVKARQFKFGLNLDAKYGEGTAEELEYLARTTFNISRAEYEDYISYYKNIVENLKEEKGIE